MQRLLFLLTVGLACLAVTWIDSDRRQACGQEQDPAAAAKDPAAAAHLFILSGQSNMAGLRPAESFTPAVEAAFGKDRVIVVHDAQGGQPIRRWYKKWETGDDAKPQPIGDLYDRLMKKVAAATKDRKLATVTFLWMQGERDARESNGDRYAEALLGVHAQLAADLGRQDIGLVIGRLSDCDMENRRYPHWTRLREVQVQVAESHPRGAWVDTDDLNDGLNRRGKEISNDLHYSAEGYKVLGSRFAEKAIALVKRGAAGDGAGR